ncbi:MAG TPA: type II secretion system F family protein [bacterium]|nr:type II secretion system F family protein [bacterium]
MLLLTFLAVLSMLAWIGSRVDDRNRTAHRLISLLGRAGPVNRRESIFTYADRCLLRLPFGGVLERQVAQAGIMTPVSAALLPAGTGICVAAGIAEAVRGPSYAVLTVLLAIFTGSAALRAARTRRIRRMETHFPAALDMLVGELRSHRSVGEAVSDVARWIPGPLGGECARVAEELRVGVPLPRALDRFRDRVPVPAVPAMVTAILVADRTGANLAECLTRQAAAARAQIAFRQEVRAMTAHARTSGMILALLPVAVAAAMMAFEGGVFEPMVATTAGRVLLGAACAMETTGWLTMRWMIRRVAA